MDLVRLKHDNVIELTLRSISKAYKQKGLQGEVPLAQRCGEAVCTAHDPHGIGDCGIHCLWRLKVLCVHSEEKRGGGGGGLCLLWQYGNLKHSKPILPKKLFIVLQKPMSGQIHISQVCG